MAMALARHRRVLRQNIAPGGSSSSTPAGFYIIYRTTGFGIISSTTIYYGGSHQFSTSVPKRWLAFISATLLLTYSLHGSG